jgi:hypothetical protein
VSEKWAHRYRTGPSGFLQAKEKLLSKDDCGDDEYKGRTESPRNGAAVFVTEKRTTRSNEDGGVDGNGIGVIRTFSPAAKKARTTDQRKAGSNSILSYFSPTIASPKQSIG